ncbi:MAG: AmmeMemoRadiSam system protein B [Ignavibacteriales bacterium]|nr:AmmeMemoRadiSam system protein B [Ignavibacteriales bacterium]
MEMVRKPAVAGTFYPANRINLEDDIQRMLNEAVIEKPVENIFALIVPHAGYIYSGKTAAFAYNLVKDKEINTVIILSPSHREYFPGISIYNGDAYQTPLGIVPINKEIRNNLTKKSKLIFEGKEGHKLEHAVEVQLPFLQIVLNNFSIVPIVIGDQKKSFLYELAEHLSKVIDDKTLLVVSSDLSHFYSKTVAYKLDGRIEQRIKNFDYEGLQNDLEMKNSEACGGGGIVAAMRTADLLNKKNSLILKRSDSGDITGDDSEVVGYLSVVIYG